MLDPHVHIRAIPAWVWAAFVFLALLYIVPEARQVVGEIILKQSTSAAPPTPAPLPQPLPIPTSLPFDDCMSKVSGFLGGYYSEMADDMELTRKYLAPYVRYFNKGRVSREQIMKNRREVAHRCRVQSYTVLGGTLTAHASTSTSCDAAYSVRAFCQSDGSTEDWAINTVIDFSGALPQITALDGSKQ